VDIFRRSYDENQIISWVPDSSFKAAYYGECILDKFTSLKVSMFLSKVQYIKTKYPGCYGGVPLVRGSWNLEELPGASL
jgi:hypothetical protein